MPIVNYYEELNLDKNKSVEELNKELNMLENIWRRREITNPEKATKMLAFIIDAREAFKSVEAKLKYDAELNKPPEDTSVDYEKERQENYQKWKKQAEYYFYTTKQNDLARDALAKATQYRNPNEDDADYYLLSSFIANVFGDTNAAMSHINNAILIDSSNALYHLHKGEIYATLYDEALKNNVNDLNRILDYLENAKTEHKKSLELYKGNGDVQGQISCLEFLAIAYAEVYNSDLKLAEEYARQAISLKPGNAEMQDLIREIQEDKNSFQPYQGANHPSTSSGKGCYIATAVYGSYDCPEVWTLRRYRDYELSSTCFGRLFIKCYYKISPILVKYFGGTVWFNRFWKIVLDKMIINLRKYGFSGERYRD